jgi:hypothetical protein
MLPRPICPGVGLPADLSDCIYRCFEAHRLQVLRRRAARKKKHQSKYQQSFQTEQYQNIPPQQSFQTEQYQYIPPQQSFQTEQYQNIPQQSFQTEQYQNIPQQSFQTEQYQNIPSQPLIPPYYPNIIQDSPQYQTLIEPTNIPAPIQTSQQSTIEYSNINQSTNLPIKTHYQQQILNTPEPYYQLKQAQYTPQQFVPSYPNIIEQSQIQSEFQQSQDTYIPPSKPITYTNENITEYQAPISQVYDSHVTSQQIIGSSIPTGTVEYTRQSYFSQEPISIQPTTTSYDEQIQSSDNQQYVDNYIPPETVQTYDQSIYTNEQIVPQQPSLPLHEEKQQHLVQETTVSEPVPSLPVTNEIHQQQEYIATNPPSYSFTPTVPPQSLPSSPPSDDGSDDAKEDEEIFDLRACICRCYGKFKNAWIQDEKERYQEQFRDIQHPIIQINEQDVQQIQQTIPEQPAYQHVVLAPPPLQYSPSLPIPQPRKPCTQVPFTIRPSEIQQGFPRIDYKTGLCLVPCPETIKYAHLPPNLRPEIFCTELPPVSSLPPPPPPPPLYHPPQPAPILTPPTYYPPPPAPIAQQQRWCVRCCCVPGKSLIKKIVHKQVEG